MSSRGKRHSGEAVPVNSSKHAKLDPVAMVDEECGDYETVDVWEDECETLTVDVTSSRAADRPSLVKSLVPVAHSIIERLDHPNRDLLNRPRGGQSERSSELPDLRETIKRKSTSNQERQHSLPKRPCYDQSMWDVTEMKSPLARSTNGPPEQMEGLYHQFMCHASRKGYDRITLAVQMLANICKAAIVRQKVYEISRKVFDDACISFWGELAMCIRVAPFEKLKYVTRFELMSFLQTIMTTFLRSDGAFPVQQVISFLPLDDFNGALKQLCHDSSKYKSLYEQSLQLLHKRDKLRILSNESPQFVVLPSRDDLMCRSIPLEMKKTKYGSNKEYLEVHFDLLRQDFIHPLRCVLHHLQEEFQEYHEDANYVDVVVYEKVKFHRKDVCGGDLVYKVCFSLPKGRKVNWNHCKRFTYGSLLCLSVDNFDTFLFATVASRDVKELRKGIATLKMLEISNPDAISSRRRYRMIESPAYFQAYSSVVNQLYAMKEEPDNLTTLVERYMVNGITEIQLPLYVKTHKEMSEEGSCLMDLKGVLCGCNSKEECNHGYDNVDITQSKAKSDSLADALDESQIDALHLALSSELTLIQGPPGTGKTFIGARFVKALLQNQSIWNPEKTVPVLVMCQTNHALDQFLEEILDLEVSRKIVRIGGRSKSQRITDLKLNIKDRKYEIREKRREMKRNMSRRSRRKYSDILQANVSFRKEDLVVAESKVEALEELCFGVQYNELNERLYCSFLNPTELDKPEFIPIMELIHFSEFDDEEKIIRAILWWFGIETKVIKKPNQSGNKVHYHAEAEEDERKVDNSEKNSAVFEGTEVFQIAKDEKQFTTFFRKLQRAGCEGPWRRDDLRHDQKLDLLKYCMRNRFKSLQKEIKALHRRKEDFEDNDEAITLMALRQADIVGVTTTGASMKIKILQQLRSKVIIVEEAAEVIEGHIVAALSKHTEHLVLIGDHKQLRPKVNDFTIGRKYGLEISLFERLIKNGLPSVQLKYQHRMRPEIAALIRPHIYKELLDHEKVKSYEPVKGMKTNVFFVDHTHPENGVEGLRSPANNHEATFIICLAQYLLTQGYDPDQITVLTPYSGQVACLKEKMDSLNIQSLRIVPIDNFQGEENDIILLSLVRSIKSGFVKEENRICVALSRARKGLYVIGNFSSLFTRESKTWADIVTSIKDTECFGSFLPLQCSLHGHVTEVASPDDFSKVKDGGCAQECGTRLRCGHICPRQCHPDDREHKNPCQKPCIRLCSSQHRCPHMCNIDPCPPCKELVPKFIPNCSHIQDVPCHLEPSDFVCKEKCTTVLDCGHKCKKTCGEKCTVACTEFVMKSLSCGHDAQTECYRSPDDQMKRCLIPCGAQLACGDICKGTCGRCHQGRLHIPCKQKCTRILTCGHTCSSKNCAEDCPPCQKACPAYCSHGPCGHKCELPCIQCAEPCQWKCPHYQCTKTCGEICNRPRCDEPCQLKLKCGHSCLGLCGEPCPQLCRECDSDNEAFTVVLFGTEDEIESRFFLLPQCKHIIEVSGLDGWMETESVAVQWKDCPRCKTSVMCNRYGDVIKKTKGDMSSIKLKESIKLESVTRNKMLDEVKKWNEELTLLRFHKIEEKSDIILQHFHTLLCAATECERLLKVYFHPPPLKPDYLRIFNQTKRLGEFVASHQCKSLSCLPQQVNNDIHSERRRLCLLVKLYEVRDAAVRKRTVELCDWNYLKDRIKELNPLNYKPDSSSKMTDENMYQVECEKVLQLYKKYNIGQPPTEEETKTIVAAIGGRKGSWFKCPNGHIYHIGQCGGAMEEGKCIECGAKIGGESHRLLEDNTHAGEMDESLHAAWSEQANLGNYEL